ncbi:MAG TPA: hypothetical protein VL793_03450, partial [Patescibacteria group bacterium]|nr:hypothetical protein [Patescibacteria group bacterium]
SLKRDLPEGAVGGDEDGIRLIMGSQPAAQWWINVALRVGSETYAHVIEPTYPNRAMIEHVIRFDEFTSGGHSLTRAQAPRIQSIGLDLSVPNATLCLDRITTYRQQRYDSWLSVVSAHPQHNIFQPGERVRLTFKPGGTIPSAAKGFRFEAQDFFEHVITNDVVQLDGSAEYQFDLSSTNAGYYELRAFWLDRNGQDLEKRSCILAEGSMPAGLATFAIMPHTVAENVNRFRTLTTNAFFGLHGDFLGLADLMGLTWRFEYSTWGALEPQKPDRSDGLAAWAAARILNEKSRPDYLPHILPLSGNFGPVAWAKPHASKSPPFFDWDDYLPMVRDYAQLEKHLYPHMHPRIYGAAWEVNLNMPPNHMEPAYTPADVVELHRQTRAAIKSIDPDACIIGPCPSNLNPGWMESIFKAGLLEQVDGIESHGYADTGFMPEENNYPSKIAALNEMMRQYNNGKVLPVYITEAGIRGLLGSRIVHRQQAQFITRLAIILKGEGIRVFLPFYGIDYDRDGWWGFCFNLEVDAKNPWMTKHISPKPAVNALATCADLLERARPVRRVTALGKDVWAYLFRRDDIFILAVWSINGMKELSLPVGDKESVRLTDVMGRSSERLVRGGELRLRVDGSPQYLIGLSANSFR